MTGRNGLKDALTLATDQARRQSGFFRVGEPRPQDELDASTREALGAHCERELRHYLVRAAYLRSLSETLPGLRSPREFVERAEELACVCSDAISALRSTFEELEIVASPESFEEPTLPNDLFEMAAELKVLGGVQEVLRAACSRYQADNCEVTALARANAVFAALDYQQGEFFASLTQWLLGQISPARAREIRRREYDAILALRSDASSEDQGDSLMSCGIPDSDMRQALMDSLELSFWNLPEQLAAMG